MSEDMGRRWKYIPPTRIRAFISKTRPMRQRERSKRAAESGKKGKARWSRNEGSAHVLRRSFRVSRVGGSADVTLFKTEQLFRSVSAQIGRQIATCNTPVFYSKCTFSETGKRLATGLSPKER
jgi:hypothetical protein